MSTSIFEALSGRLFPNGQWTYSFHGDGSINTGHLVCDPYEISIFFSEELRRFRGVVTVDSTTEDNSLTLLELYDYEDSSKLLLDLFANMIMFETETRKFLGL